MAITFVAAGALGLSATVTPITVAAPALQAGDIMIAALINKELAVTMSPPDSTWTELYQADADCTTAADDHRAAVYWKRASQADSAAGFSFSKSADNNVLLAGVIGAWRGCAKFVSPIDATAVGGQVNAAAADNVSFPAFDPTYAGSGTCLCHVVFIAFYGNDATTFAAAMSVDANPDCTTRWDLETSAGTDCSIACTSGDNDGSSIAARTWASTSTVDAGSTAVVFGLIPDPCFTIPHYQSFKAGDGVSVSENIK